MTESNKGLAICYDIYDKEGNLSKIEVQDASGEHIFDALWDDRDAQTSENREEFRRWVQRMIRSKGYTVAE